jgi:hypothetical protein
MLNIVRIQLWSVSTSFIPVGGKVDHHNQNSSLLLLLLLLINLVIYFALPGTPLICVNINHASRWYHHNQDAFDFVYLFELIVVKFALVDTPSICVNINHPGRW